MEMNAKLPYTVQCPALCESSQKYEELGFAFVCHPHEQEAWKVTNSIL
jgi:hypothetical protein